MSAPYAYYAYDSDPYGLRADSQSFIDAQADSYRMRGMVDRPRYPEPPMESLPAEAVSGSYSGHYRMPPQGLVLASSHRLASFADIISLDEALRAGPSTVIEKLHLDGFELIAYYRLSATWLAVLARLPNLKTLRFSGSDDQRLLVGHAVSPFPSLGPIPNVRGALQKVTEVFIDNVRCLTLNHLLSHLTGLSSLQFLSLRHILCEQPPDPAEPPVWHHHFARLSHVAVHDCDDPTSLAWLYATPPLINRLHVMQKEIPHVDPFLAFFDARYIMLCIRAFCKVQNSLVAKVKTSHYICRGSDTYQITFTLRNGAVAPFRAQEPFSPGFGGWGKVYSRTEELEDLWQKECREIGIMLRDELRATGQTSYTQEQLTKGCMLCKRI